MSSPKPPPNASLRVPKGFFNLMDVFVKSILKNKPLDVFEYGARFFENLLQVRTDTGHDPAIHGAKSEDGFIDVSVKVSKGGKGKKKKKRSNPSQAHFTKGSNTGHKHAGIKSITKETATVSGETGI